MQQASQLAGKEMFVVLNVRLVPIPAQADYDAAAAASAVAFGQWMEVMYRNCWFELKIGRKKYIDQVAPLAVFSSGFGPGTVSSGVATVTRVESWPNFGTADIKSVWNMDPPITIVAQENIDCAAYWKTALAVTTAGKLGCIFDGFLVGPAQ